MKSLKAKKNKLYISGDSFCESRNYPYPGPQEGKQYAWFNDVSEYFKDSHEFILDSYGSRDVQTILDNWIKIIPNLKPNDILIICIPMFIRQRVPLRKKDWMVNKWSNGEIVNRFVTHQSWYKTSTEKIWIGNYSIERNELDNHTNFFTQLNMCESVEENYTEVIESLYKITPCKKYIFSWDDMKHKTDIIEYKKDITEKLGWSTLDDLYKETNGEAGREYDFHWDYKFEKIFADYIKNKFKK